MDACPKCAYARQPKDLDPYLECPRCGIVFAKYAKHHAAPAPVPAEGPVEVAEEAEELPLTFWQRAHDRLFELPEKPDPLVMAAQALVLAVMVAWGIRLITYKVITAEIMYSFLHNVDLPIHEFGHVLFRPLGEWMMYLGGSLFQCLLPALIGMVFLFRQRNPFAAAFCLWWTAENVLDVAPYIRDAKLMAMPLVGEWNDEVAELHVLRHDWHNILLKFNAVDAAPVLGSLAHALGAGLMALSWLWGGLWLWKAWQQQRDAAY
ncbi:MAG TPA: zinc ribbon domain-containing protein [Gammaproteobacteria bacterium]